MRVPLMAPVLLLWKYTGPPTTAGFGAAMEHDIDRWRGGSNDA